MVRLCQLGGWEKPPRLRLPCALNPKLRSASAETLSSVSEEKEGGLHFPKKRTRISAASRCLYQVLVFKRLKAASGSLGIWGLGKLYDTKSPAAKRETLRLAEGIQGLVHCSPCSKKGSRVEGIVIRALGIIGVACTSEHKTVRLVQQPPNQYTMLFFGMGYWTR